MEENKNKFVPDNRDMPFALLFILGTFISLAWGIWGGLRLGYAISHVIALAIGTAYFVCKDKKITVYGLLCGIISLLLALPFAITSNAAVRILSAFAGVLLEWVWFASLSGKAVFNGDLGLFGFFLGAFFYGIGDMPKSVKAAASAKTEKSKKTLKILAGVLCAVPVLAVVIPLLISSDVAFETLAMKILPDAAPLAAQIILTIIIAPFIIGFAFSLKKREKSAFESKSFKGFDTAFSASFFAAVSLCYIVYLFSQLAYFFSAFSGFLPPKFEFSYAEYARRGFFELCAIAGINLVLIFFMIIFSKKKDGKIPAILKIFGCFIGAFTLLISATALSKMYLYIRNYGMTVLRIGTSVFMIIMALTFIAVIIRLFNEKIKVLQFALAVSGIALVVLGTFNINSLVVKYNYDAYKSGRLKEIDINYLYEIGEESVPYLYKLTDDKETEKNAEFALWSICNEMFYVEFDEKTNKMTGIEKIKTEFYENNSASKRAYEIFDENFDELFDGFLNDYEVLGTLFEQAWENGEIEHN